MLLAGLFGDCDAGIAKLNQSLALDEQYSATYQNLGNVALTCGDRAEGEERHRYYAMAEEAYLAQMELESCNLQVLTALGYAQSQMGDNGKSIDTNLNGLRCVGDPTSPNTVQFHRNLAILYQLESDLESAVIHARSAAQAAGNNYNSMLDAARILVSLNALEDAYQVAQRIESLDLQQWNQLRDLAVLYLQTGHPDRGLSPAQKALESAPEDKQAEIQELLATLQSQNTP